MQGRIFVLGEGRTNTQFSALIKMTVCQARIVHPYRECGAFAQAWELVVNEIYCLMVLINLSVKYVTALLGNAKNCSDIPSSLCHT